MPSKTHDARLKEPSQFKTIRRQNDKFGKGIDVTWGIGKDKKAVIQSIHFDPKKFKFPAVKAWLKDHSYNALKVTPAVVDEAVTTTDIATFAPKIGAKPEMHPLLKKLSKYFKDADPSTEKSSH